MLNGVRTTDANEFHVSPQMELSFVTGDVIYVYGDMDEDGFFMGELNGVRGLVPSNFLTEASNQLDARGHVSSHSGQRAAES